MSAAEPGSSSDEPGPADSIEQVLIARNRPIDGFDVARLLPAAERRMVGPFIFFDHFGPDSAAAGAGVRRAAAPAHQPGDGDLPVRGRACSTGTAWVRSSAIDPGAINWMTAGPGHRALGAHAARPARHRLAGARPAAVGGAAPGGRGAATRASATTRPNRCRCGDRRRAWRVRVLVGSAFGVTSPVAVLSPTIYAEIAVAGGRPAGAADDHEQRGVYVVDGAVTTAGVRAERRQLIVFRRGVRPVLRAEAAAPTSC